MSVFSAGEIAYLQSQRIGRLATIGPDGLPHVVPLRYRYNAELDAIELGGHGMGTSRKYRDIAREGRAAFVVDDTTEHGPRGLEVRGRAEALPIGGTAIWPDVDDQFIRLWPARIAAWGIDGDPYAPRGRRAGK
jgi:pyridoxamine 5'-phosphate oxidase family protein